MTRPFNGKVLEVITRALLWMWHVSYRQWHDNCMWPDWGL